jgi:excisionase family DNA binding protein
MSTGDQSSRKASQQTKPQFSTIAAIAQRLDVSPRTVHRWIASHELVVHRIGRSVRISEADLKAFLVSHRDDH